MKTKKIISYLVGFLILFVVLYYLGIEHVIFILSRTDLVYFFLAGFFYLVVEILASLKLKFISGLSLKDIFLSHQGGMLLSYITPGRVGYLYSPYSLAKKEECSVGRMFGLVSLIQGVMLSSKIFSIGLALIYFYFVFEISNYFFLSFLTPVLILLVILFALYSSKSKDFLSRIPFVNRFVSYLEIMQDSVKRVSKKKALGMVFLDLSGWFFYGCQLFLLATALGLSLSFLTCLMLQSLITALLFIPISPSALGIAESGNALLFSLIGIDASLGVAFLLLFRFNALLVDSIGLFDFKTVGISEEFKKIFVD